MRHLEPDSLLGLTAIDPDGPRAVDQPRSKKRCSCAFEDVAAGLFRQAGAGARIDKSQGLGPGRIWRPAAVGDEAHPVDEHLKSERLAAGCPAEGPGRRRSGVHKNLQPCALQPLVTVPGSGPRGDRAGLIGLASSRGGDIFATALIPALERGKRPIGEREKPDGSSQPIDRAAKLIRRRQAPKREGLVQGAKIEEKLKGRFGAARGMAAVRVNADGQGLGKTRQCALTQPYAPISKRNSPGKGGHRSGFGRPLGPLDASQQKTPLTHEIARHHERLGLGAPLADSLRPAGEVKEASFQYLRVPGEGVPVAK